MCTVTFSPRRRGYALAMNRDEKLTRVAGLPPAEKIIQGRAVLAPSEPGGGTWLALNDSGVTFALINWYAITARVRARSASRGQVVRSHSPHPGPFSICMHRADAATVSFREVMVLANQAVMRHQA